MVARSLSPLCCWQCCPAAALLLLLLLLLLLMLLLLLSACSSQLFTTPTPLLCRRQRLAQRLAQRGRAPETQALAAALVAAQQQQSVRRECSCSIAAPTCLDACSSSASSQDAVWTLGGCAHAGDVWCLLQLALHCSSQAAAAASPKRRHRLYMQALRLMRQAAAEVHGSAADWDTFLRGGASAALGSFVALCPSGGGAGVEAAAQLERVARLVTDAASEEGGIELWALQVRLLCCRWPTPGVRWGAVGGRGGAQLRLLFVSAAGADALRCQLRQCMPQGYALAPTAAPFVCCSCRTCCSGSRTGWQRRVAWAEPRQPQALPPKRTKTCMRPQQHAPMRCQSASNG